MASAQLIRLDFEVFGKVQGVFFRKYTQAQAQTFQVKGWIRNTARRTVEGQLEGEEENVKKMKQWLRNTGSPGSRIERADFKNEVKIQEYSFKAFGIR